MAGNYSDLVVSGRFYAAAFSSVGFACFLALFVPIFGDRSSDLMLIWVSKEVRLKWQAWVSESATSNFDLGFWPLCLDQPQGQWFFWTAECSHTLEALFLVGKTKRSVENCETLRSENQARIHSATAQNRPFGKNCWHHNHVKKRICIHLAVPVGSFKFYPERLIQWEIDELKERLLHYIMPTVR